MKKYKIIFDRNLCIGAAQCVSISKRFWEIDEEDGKAVLKNGKKVGHEVFELEISEEFYKEALDSSEVCPVPGCIKVEELKQ